MTKVFSSFIFYHFFQNLNLKFIRPEHEHEKKEALLFRIVIILLMYNVRSYVARISLQKLTD